MAFVDDITEEVLSWAEESDQKLLEYLGRKLADDEPMGFMAGGFADSTSLVAGAEKWLDENTRHVIEAYDNNEGLDETALAIKLADTFSTCFASMPLGVLSLIVARRIIYRHNDLYKDQGEGKVPEPDKQSQDFSNKSSARLEKGQLSRRLRVQTGSSNPPTKNLDIHGKISYTDDIKAPGGAVKPQEPDERPRSLKPTLPNDNELNSKGKPRIKAKPRTREEIGGDPNDEINRQNVSLGARVPSELRVRFDAFVKANKDKGMTKIKATTIALEEFLDRYDND